MPKELNIASLTLEYKIDMTSDCHSERFVGFDMSQGGGKRKGSIAVYLEPWHADIMAFLDLKKNHGNELERARDLFYAMWIPDLFMQVCVDSCVQGVAWYFISIYLLFFVLCNCK